MVMSLLITVPVSIRNGHYDSPTTFSHIANKAVKQIDLTLIFTAIQVTPPCDSLVPYLPKKDTLLYRHWIGILEIWSLSIFHLSSGCVCTGNLFSLNYFLLGTEGLTTLPFCREEFLGHIY